MIPVLGSWVVDTEEMAAGVTHDDGHLHPSTEEPHDHIGLIGSRLRLFSALDSGLD
jgi:hypothetical protein